MFKIKKVEAIKSKIQQLKFAGIWVWIIFILMLINIIYINFKLIEISKEQKEIINSI